jgi:predicted small lipoprotein YifL
MAEKAGEGRLMRRAEKFRLDCPFWYGPAAPRSRFVTRTDRLFPRLVLMGALAAALAVGGCGRKGPLDAPPGGAAEVQAGGQPSTQSGTAVSRGGAGGLPRVQGQDKRIPLDALLN